MQTVDSFASFRDRFLAALRALCVTLLAAMLLDSASFAGDWQKDWQSVKGQSAKKCAELFDSFQLQAICMENEKHGYEKLQGNFSMPTDIANKAKDRCERLFDTFQLQAVCMENERTGYEKLRQ